MKGTGENWAALIEGTRIKFNAPLFQHLVAHVDYDLAKEAIGKGTTHYKPKKRTMIINNPRCATVDEMTLFARLIGLSVPFLIIGFDMALDNMSEDTKQLLIAPSKAVYTSS